MNRNQYYQKHQHLQLDRNELERKYQAHQRELEDQMMWEAAMRVQGAQVAAVSSGGGGNPAPLLPLTLLFDSVENANLLVGDASNVSDWNTFFDLPTNGTPFTSVEIIGNEVRLFGGSSIAMTNGGNYLNNLFSGNLNILEVDDQAGCIVILGDGLFYNADNLVSAKLNAALTAGEYVFGSDFTSLLSAVEMDSLVSGTSVFYSCPNILSISLPSLISANSSGNSDGFFSILNNCTVFNLPNLINIGDYCFSYCQSLASISLLQAATSGFNCFESCTSLVTVDLPLLTNTESYFFSGCTSLTTINLPSCTNLGGTVGNDNVFINIIGNTIALTVPAALMTCNGGNPDGDIQYMQGNNSVTVITT